MCAVATPAYMQGRLVDMTMDSIYSNTNQRLSRRVAYSLALCSSGKRLRTSYRFKDSLQGLYTSGLSYVTNGKAGMMFPQYVLDFTRTFYLIYC